MDLDDSLISFLRPIFQLYVFQLVKGYVVIIHLKL